MAPHDVYEILAINRFLNGLREGETLQTIRLVRLKRAQDVERSPRTNAGDVAIKQSAKSNQCVRAASSKPSGKSFSNEKLFQKFIDALTNKIRSCAAGNIENCVRDT